MEPWVTAARASSQVRRPMVQISQQLSVRMTAMVRTVVEEGHVVHWLMRILVGCRVRFVRTVQRDFASLTVLWVRTQAHPVVNLHQLMVDVDAFDVIVVA